MGPTITLDDHVARLTDEGLISSTAGAVILRANKATIVRWSLQGYLRADGTRVYLEHIRSGRRIMTSEPALRRFLVAQQSVTPPPAPITDTPARATRAAAKAHDQVASLLGSAA